MCVNIWATVGLSAVALASKPPSGTRRSRFTRIVLFRSQESSRLSSRLWSSVFDIVTSVEFNIARGTATLFRSVLQSASEASAMPVQVTLAQVEQLAPNIRSVYSDGF